MVRSRTQPPVSGGGTTQPSVDGLLLLTATPEQLGWKATLPGCDCWTGSVSRPRIISGRVEGLQGSRRDCRETACRNSAHGNGHNFVAPLVRMIPSWNHACGIESGQRGIEVGVAGRAFGFARPRRVLFRNTRAGMKGFPKRTAHLVKLEPGPEPEHWLDRGLHEFAEDAGDIRLQPRLIWRAIREFSGWWNCCGNWIQIKFW